MLVYLYFNKVTLLLVWNIHFFDSEANIWLSNTPWSHKALEFLKAAVKFLANSWKLSNIFVYCDQEACFEKSKNKAHL